MKKQICINVDVEHLIVAKKIIPNISSYLNECLKGVHGKSATYEKEDQILEEIKTVNNTIQESNIKKSILEMNLKVLKEQIEEDKRLKEQKELKTRWRCGVCGELNLLEDLKCRKCCLPTRHDSKSKEVLI